MRYLKVMSCTSPILAYKLGRNPEDPKKLKIKILPQRPDMNLLKARALYGDDLLLLPCGKCIGCCNDYAKMWSDRIVLEAGLYEKNCFLTLTYKDAPEFPKKSDVQDFIRRLRNSLDQKIRFFAVGERGSTTKRSHYHIIIFGYDFDDKVPLFKSDANQLYRSPSLEKLWPLGISSIGAVSPQSAAYCARYSMKKKLTGFDDGEFIMMSTHPGIGKKYFDDHKNEIFMTDSCFSRLAPGKKLSIPRYFRKLADREELLVPGYDRFVGKIQQGMKNVGDRGVRSVANEEESLQMSDRLNHFEKRVRNKL